jgi:hypothetical protein
MKIFIQNKGEETLDKRHYLTSGGEGSIYVKSGTAYKIYTDAKKMLPVQKIKELSVISSPQVIKPENIILDDSKTPVGYTMKFIKDTVALCQLFTKAYKDRSGIKPQTIINLVSQMRTNIQSIHNNKILIVDLNEMNFLVDDNYKDVYFIDTDSYQTPSYPATAIMESIRDRHCDYSKQKNDENTDWFSYGIITFQMFIGIHPYKGKHGSISNLDDRMMKNISVFNKDVSIPKVAYPLDSIPEGYRNWYKAVFEEGKRIAPPSDMQAFIQFVQATVKTVSGTSNFDVTKIKEYIGLIHGYLNVNNVDMVLTEQGFYIGDKVDRKVSCKSAIAVTPVMQHIISAVVNNGMTRVYDITMGKDIEVSFDADQVFSIDNRLYAKKTDSIYEITFTEVAHKLIPGITLVSNILEMSTKVYDGVVIQDLLNSYHVSLFPASGQHQQVKVAELSGYRIIDAKYRNRVLMVVVEKKGNYSKMIFKFDDAFTYDVRKIDGITYSAINFTVLDNGICVHINEKEEIELFFNKKGKNDIKVVQDDSLADAKLFSNGNLTLIAKDDILYSIKMK